MIDIKLIREQTEKVKEGVVKKNFDPAKVDAVLEADKKRLEILQKVESLRQERNTLGKEDYQRGSKIKEELKTLEPELEIAETEYKELINAIPNLPADDVPEGKGEADNIELRKVGDIPKFNFEPKDHVELGKLLDILDFEAGSKVTGAGFYFLKNAGALLEIALINYGLRFLSERGFTPVVTPDLAKERYYLGTGYLPKGEEAQTYKIEDSDLGLIATAEVTLAGYHADEILDIKKLPKKYAGFSHCFRMESGSYGKYSKGLYRVHQFSKVEMFVFAAPGQSAKIHEELLEVEEEFWKSLGVPYRVIQQCTGDLGAQAVKKFDLEAWMPGRGDYGEITSTSNTTDYQARNLGIRVKDGEKTEYAHTLNGTLVANSRGPIAILENFQREDGSVKIPEVLIPFMGISEIRTSSARNN